MPLSAPSDEMAMSLTADDCQETESGPEIVAAADVA